MSEMQSAALRRSGRSVLLTGSSGRHREHHDGAVKVTTRICCWTLVTCRYRKYASLCGLHRAVTTAILTFEKRLTDDGGKAGDKGCGHGQSANLSEFALYPSIPSLLLLLPNHAACEHRHSMFPLTSPFNSPIPSLMRRGMRCGTLSVRPGVVRPFTRHRPHLLMHALREGRNSRDGCGAQCDTRFARLCTCMLLLRLVVHKWTGQAGTNTYRQELLYSPWTDCRDGIWQLDEYLAGDR
ncbi:hypothetical protein N657DRAFT_421406 [Parathielavia appendiculata]|uniref:Uncharacterized protein n=1 Tax=Parathielavia appendiculata TaxID=2587402 RepID=A0AAN6TZM3_9PEZI|nr:hypothetical protein N657DRAFT_421406 [Parathielavia appendiculata]